MEITRGSRSKTRKNLGLPALVLVLPALLAGCSKPGKAGAAGRDYTLRGVVRQLPDPKDPGTSFYLEHEAIPNFVNREGEASEMMSMTMPFDLARGVSLDGVAVGDPVEATMHVDWEADRPVELTRLAELPPGTRLDIPPAEPEPK